MAVTRAWRSPVSSYSAISTHADWIIISLDNCSGASLAYDPQVYDDIPTYTWDKNFNIDHFGREIDMRNDLIWSSVKHAICGKLVMPLRLSGYSKYSTRRIRRQICGSTLAAVQAKQITLPVVMPW